MSCARCPHTAAIPLRPPVALHRAVASIAPTYEKLDGVIVCEDLNITAVTMGDLWREGGPVQVGDAVLLRSPVNGADSGIYEVVKRELGFWSLIRITPRERVRCANCGEPRWQATA